MQANKQQHWENLVFLTTCNKRLTEKNEKNMSKVWNKIRWKTLFTPSQHICATQWKKKKFHLNPGNFVFLPAAVMELSHVAYTLKWYTIRNKNVQFPLFCKLTLTKKKVQQKENAVSIERTIPYTYTKKIPGYKIPLSVMSVLLDQQLK